MAVWERVTDRLDPQLHFKLSYSLLVPAHYTARMHARMQTSVRMLNLEHFGWSEALFRTQP